MLRCFLIVVAVFFSSCVPEPALVSIVQRYWIYLAETDIYFQESELD